MTHPEEVPQTPDATGSTPASPVPRRAAIAVGAALVLGGAALAVWAVTSTASPSSEVTPPASAPADATASASASASPAVAAPPAPGTTASAPPSVSGQGPVISAFSVDPTIAACPDERASTVPLVFSWTSEGADRAWIGVGTSDASVQPAAEVGSSTAGFSGLAFACSDADQVFTLTVQGAGGRVSETIAITRELD